MFRQKVDKIFKDLHKVFGITDDILIVGYDADGRDLERILRQVMLICHQENSKLNKNKCHFRCMWELFLEK